MLKQIKFGLRKHQNMIRTIIGNYLFYFSKSILVFLVINWIFKKYMYTFWMKFSFQTHYNYIYVWIVEKKLFFHYQKNIEPTNGFQGTNSINVTYIMGKCPVHNKTALCTGHPEPFIQYWEKNNLQNQIFVKKYIHIEVQQLQKKNLHDPVKIL